MRARAVCFVLTLVTATLRGTLASGQATPGSAAPASPNSTRNAAPTGPVVLPTLDGWKLTDGPTSRAPDALFEYIDGAADLFLQFDVRELVSGTYSNGEKAEVTVDIYRHRDAVRAFGVYTQERPAGTTPIDVGIEGYGDSDHLAFVVGDSYVKLVQFGGRDPRVLRSFASAIAGRLPGTRQAPAVLKAFPARGKLARAERLAARDFLGYAFLHDAVAVPYEVGGAHFRLFAIHGSDEADVRTMVLGYLRIAKLPAESMTPTGAASFHDPVSGEVTLQWNDRWLWGAVDDASPGRHPLVEELGKRLSAY
jgi:hypothetical protein